MQLLEEPRTWWRAFRRLGFSSQLLHRRRGHGRRTILNGTLGSGVHFLVRVCVKQRALISGFCAGVIAQKTTLACWNRGPRIEVSTGKKKKKNIALPTRQTGTLFQYLSSLGLRSWMVWLGECRPRSSELIPQYIRGRTYGFCLRVDHVWGPLEPVGCPHSLPLLLYKQPHKTLFFDNFSHLWCTASGIIEAKAPISQRFPFLSTQLISRQPKNTRAGTRNVRVTKEHRYENRLPTPYAGRYWVKISIKAQVLGVTGHLSYTGTWHKLDHRGENSEQKCRCPSAFFLRHYILTFWASF